MNKSTITLQLPIKLFDPNSYVPLANHANGTSKQQYKTFNQGFSFFVYGSSELSDDEWLMPLCFIDYAQITIFLNLTTLLCGILNNIKQPYKNAIFGIHNNPTHYSKMFIGILE